MADLDFLTLRDQNILLWMAEAELGVAAPLPAPIADMQSEQVAEAVDRLVCLGLLQHDLVLLKHDLPTLSNLYASLTAKGAQAVVALWRQRLRELPDRRRLA